MPRLIRNNQTFRKDYHLLEKGDVIAGQLNLRQCEEYIFLDLLARGIKMVPHPLAQQLSRSKCMQAQVYGQFMPPGTAVIRCHTDLVKKMQEYAERGTGRVITKQDRGDCGRGINLWPSVEDVYNASTLNPAIFPFVMQPFLSRVTDVRVIIIGDYMESYWRRNPVSFRHNLHFGGESGPYRLDRRCEEMCQAIMKRGRFPFAHIDLLISMDGEAWLGEISLRGGIKGAAISTKDYMERINGIYEEIAARLLKGEK